ncbi:GtrA family protein [Marivita geojedonensis]|uniref:GtrA/DPMS transmembrane domain-containing protein n=1 Tax=Marivita geojedonensis TaxID=1123756 RepID=A0A1X4NCG4_9RHOB|nr:GtrA family protein [Marivita geojedonensis]OSQ44335.1 hypothetical protein MGEO_19175 [Marivita geojedonensis]
MAEVLSFFDQTMSRGWVLFIRFLIFSGSAALVNFLTGQLLYGVFGLIDGTQYAISVATAFLLGMLVSYTLHRRFTFPPSGRRRREEIRVFFFVSIGGLLLTTSIAQSLFTGAAGALTTVSRHLPVQLQPETLAHLVAIGLTAFYSFFAHRDLSFRRTPTPLQTQSADTHK